MNKFTTSIVRLDYDEPVALSDVLRISAADPVIKDFAGVCGITHGVAQPNQYGIRLRVGKHVLPKGAVMAEVERLQAEDTREIPSRELKEIALENIKARTPISYYHYNFLLFRTKHRPESVYIAGFGLTDKKMLEWLPLTDGKGKRRLSLFNYPIACILEAAKFGEPDLDGFILGERRKFVNKELGVSASGVVVNPVALASALGANTVCTAVDIELAVGLDVQVCTSSNTLTVYYEGEESLPRFDLSREPDDVAADMVMYAGILETIVEKMESLI
jgi:hypothetical protein|nr:MAG TPA: hypothetical protein [Caudoviricetes sp.]